MPFKLNISDKEGKAWRLETEETGLVGKSVGDIVKGEDVGTDFAGYEFEITGGSDSSGFPLSKDVEGIGLKRVLLTRGWGMHKRPRGDKKKVPQPKGLRLRKTVRGKTISETTVQINIKLLKEGGKKLSEIFSDQNKPAEAAAEEATPVEKQLEETKVEETKPKQKEEVKEESKPEEAPEEKQEEPKEEKPSEEKKE